MQKINLGLAILTSFLVIIFLIQPLTQVSLEDGWPPVPSIIVFNPLPSYVETYQNTNVPLWVEVRLLDTSPAIVSVSYNVDANSNVTLNDFEKRHEFFSNKQIFVFSFKSNIENLSNGNHTLKVYSLDANGDMMFTQKDFTVDTAFRIPKITIISPLNQTYTENKVSLIYSVDADVSKAAYAVDLFSGLISTPLNGNSTVLGNLTEGSHMVLISANVHKSNNYYGIMETTYFNINTTKTENPLALGNQTMTLGITIAVIVVGAIIAVILYKRRKKV